jgi:EAL domain-containing protein (putative c-di-GMP-specific phosphodiesterase class I)
MGLVFGTLVDQHTELADAMERFGWAYDARFRCAVAEVGPDCSLGGAGEVFALLAGVLGEQEAGRVGAVWLGSAPLEDQARELLQAEPLRTFSPPKDSPLAGLLEHRGLETWFQPIFDGEAATVFGHECLARAHHPGDGTLISPARMIDWARRENLLFMFDRVCRETHIERAAASAFGSDHLFLINFLPSVIYEPQFCLRTTVQALERTGLRADQIVFEVVESEAIEDHDHLRKILAYYRENGFRFALDDVGSGYSGLSLMADLDPDLIKIDRALVGRADHCEGHAEVCRAIVNLARSRGSQVLAEGVETESQWAFMRALGVDLVQGFLLGRPGPATSPRV